MVRIASDNTGALHLCFLQLEVIHNGFDTNIIDALLCNYHCFFRTIKQRYATLHMWEILFKWLLYYTSCGVCGSLPSTYQPHCCQCYPGVDGHAGSIWAVGPSGEPKAVEVNDTAEGLAHGNTRV